MSLFEHIGFGGKKITNVALRRLNLIAAGLLGVQGLLILFLSDSSRGIVPIRTGFLSEDKLASEVGGQTVLAPASKTLFDLNLAYLVAAFLLISAVIHLLIATRYRRRYEADLKSDTNRFRWIDYSLSIGLMMTAIALLVGIYDLAAIVMIFGLTALICLLKLQMENSNKRPAANWSSYKLGVKAGALPWVAILIYVWGAYAYGSSLPGYVYAILASTLIIFGALGFTMYKLYKNTGPWKNYLYGERTYIVLGLLAKTLLAWQIFAGAL